jgi:hypothetical protein
MEGGRVAQGARSREPRVSELSEVQLTGDSAKVLESRAGTRRVAPDDAPQPMAMSGQHAASKRRPARKASCCDCIVDMLETFGSDIFNDLAARLPWYANDWLATHGNSCTGGGLVKVLSASLFSYISSILPAIVIGDLLFASTGGQLGLPEVSAPVRKMQGWVVWHRGWASGPSLHVVRLVSPKCLPSKSARAVDWG